MKKMLLAAAALVAITAPAASQSYTPEVGSGNVVNAPFQGNHAYPYQGRRLRLSVPYEAYAQSRTANGFQSPNVINGGQEHYVGTDPDPRIRARLHRESQQGRW
jgi:opacity protein-like surface antigen